MVARGHGGCRSRRLKPTPRRSATRDRPPAVEGNRFADRHAQLGAKQHKHPEWHRAAYIQRSKFESALKATLFARGADTQHAQSKHRASETQSKHRETEQAQSKRSLENHREDRTRSKHRASEGHTTASAEQARSTFEYLLRCMYDSCRHRRYQSLPAA